MNSAPFLLKASPNNISYSGLRSCLSLPQPHTSVPPSHSALAIFVSVLLVRLASPSPPPNLFWNVLPPHPQKAASSPPQVQGKCYLLREVNLCSPLFLMHVFIVVFLSDLPYVPCADPAGMPALSACFTTVCPRPEAGPGSQSVLKKKFIE